MVLKTYCTLNYAGILARAWQRGNETSTGNIRSCSTVWGVSKCYNNIGIDKLLYPNMDVINMSNVVAM